LADKDLCYMRSIWRQCPDWHAPTAVQATLF